MKIFEHIKYKESLNYFNYNKGKINLQKYDLEVFSEVSKEGLKRKDKVIVKPIYNLIEKNVIKDLYLKVFLKDKVGLIEIKYGKEILKPIYSEIMDFDENNFLKFKLKEKIGLLNIKGKEVLKPLYDSIILKQDYYELTLDRLPKFKYYYKKNKLEKIIY